MLRNLLMENPQQFQNPFNATPVGFLKLKLLNAPIGLFFDLADFLDIFFFLKCNGLLCETISSFTIAAKLFFSRKIYILYLTNYGRVSEVRAH